VPSIRSKIFTSGEAICGYVLLELFDVRPPSTALCQTIQGFGKDRSVLKTCIQASGGHESNQKITKANYRGSERFRANQLVIRHPFILSDRFRVFGQHRDNQIPCLCPRFDVVE